MGQAAIKFELDHRHSIAYLTITDHLWKRKIPGNMFVNTRTLTTKVVQ